MRLPIVLLLLSSFPKVSAYADIPRMNPVYLGERFVTGYQSRANQTDSSPHETSIGVRTSTNVVAVSQDWLKTHRLKYGDRVFIEGVGERTVLDCMNKRYQKRFDVWVRCTVEEHYVGVFKTRRNVWLLR